MDIGRLKIGNKNENENEVMEGDMNIEYNIDRSYRYILRVHTVSCYFYYSTWYFNIWSNFTGYHFVRFPFVYFILPSTIKPPLLSRSVSSLSTLWIFHCTEWDTRMRRQNSPFLSSLTVSPCSGKSPPCISLRTLLHLRSSSLPINSSSNSTTGLPGIRSYRGVA